MNSVRSQEGQVVQETVERSLYYPGAHALAGEGGRAALVSASTGGTISYEDLHHRALRLARGFRSLGVGPGDHVAFCLENRLDYPVLWWGAHYAGLYYPPISTRLTAGEVAHIVADAGSKILVISPGVAERLLPDVAPQIPGVRVLVAGGTHAGAEPLDRLLAGPGTETFDPLVEGAVMLYTSGTTGVPKGVKRPLTGKPLGSPSPVALLAQQLFGLGPGSVYLSPAPLYHAAPVGFVGAATALGATAVVMERFDAEGVLAAIERHGVTHAQFVPTMFTRLLALPEAARTAYDLSTLRYAIHAAAPCPVPVKQAMVEWWGPIIHEYYSGTEGAGFCYCSPDDWISHQGSVGRPLLGEIHIVDDDGRELPAGEQGTIYFGNGVPFEYHNDPAKTADAHLSGWASFGDVGWVDEDGFLYLTDRRSDLIITGGVNVYPQEAENVLAAHPAVFDVAVFGVPHEEFGEEVKAVVQPAPGYAVDSALEVELIAWCRRHLADLKCPRTVEFRDALPREETGKLLRRHLRDEFRRAHGPDQDR